MINILLHGRSTTNWTPSGQGLFSLDIFLNHVVDKEPYFRNVTGANRIKIYGFDLENFEIDLRLNSGPKSSFFIDHVPL